jgi:serine protease Do
MWRIIMKRNALLGNVTSVVIALLLGAGLAGQWGCEKQKGPSEVVGFPQSFADLAERVKPAVVNISTTTTLRIPGSPFRHFFGPDEEGPSGDFFRHFFGDVPDRELREQSLGSGFIIEKDGYIITNNHVVEGADEIKVKLTDGREFMAKVVGRDPKTDLALIKISSIFKDLPVISLGDSEKARVGDWVLAFGNPFGLEHTVTQGIISATGRVIGTGPYDNFIQTDAPINPGNSGGPLVNLKGEVIGINSAILPGGQGIGFAIPSNLAKTVVSQLKERGKVVRGWIGISIQSVTPDIAKAFGLKEPRGALVGDVAEGGPADKGGIRKGDIILSFDGKEIKNSSALPRVVAETAVGKEVDVGIMRDGRETHVTVRVEEMTEKRIASQLGRAGAGLGMRVEDITPDIQRRLRLREKSGVVVVDVAAGSPAGESGIQPGDVIREVDRKPVRSVKEYGDALGKHQRDSALLLLIRRDSQTFYVSVRTTYTAPIEK